MKGNEDHKERRLSEDDITEFHQKGFLGPFRLCSPDEMKPIRKHIRKSIANDSAKEGPKKFIDRHKRCEDVSDIVTHPDIVQRIADLYGPDLICPRSRIWPKPPGESYVPWHQDGAYYSFSPPLTISAWVAISEATTENGCMRLVPGTHHGQFDSHQDVEEPDKTVFGKGIDSSEIPEDEIVKMELEPGEFFLFTEKTVHSSTNNESDSARLGLSIRVSPSFVHLNPDTSDPERDVVLLNGENHNPTTTTVSPPTNCQH